MTYGRTLALGAAILLLTFPAPKGEAQEMGWTYSVLAEGFDDNLTPTVTGAVRSMDGTTLAAITIFCDGSKLMGRVSMDGFGVSFNDTWQPIGHRSPSRPVGDRFTSRPEIRWNNSPAQRINLSVRRTASNVGDIPGDVRAFADKLAKNNHIRMRIETPLSGTQVFHWSLAGTASKLDQLSCYNAPGDDR